MMCSFCRRRGRRRRRTRLPRVARVGGGGFVLAPAVGVQNGQEDAMDKFTIIGLEGGASGVTVEAQFNPKEIAKPQ